MDSGAYMPQYVELLGSHLEGSRGFPEKTNLSPGIAMLSFLSIGEKYFGIYIYKIGFSSFLVALEIAINRQKYQGFSASKQIDSWFLGVAPLWLTVWWRS